MFHTFTLEFIFQNSWLPYTICWTFTVPMCVHLCVCLCVHECINVCVCVWFCHRLMSRTAFILFNLSLISPVWNFNSCNKSASGYRGEEKFSHTHNAEKRHLCVSVNSLVCACVSVCVFCLQCELLIGALLLSVLNFMDQKHCLSDATKTTTTTTKNHSQRSHSDVFTDSQIKYTFRNKTSSCLPFSLLKLLDADHV